MGLLSFLFKKKYASKDEFPILCFNLSNHFSSIRRNWLQGIKSIMETYTGKSLDDILLDQGPVDAASKAFQVLTSARLVSAKMYVHPSETKSFSDLLYAEVFGDTLMECLECVKMYETYANASQMHHQISKDMAQCFLSATASEEEILRITPTVDIFTILIQMVTADVFADYKTVKKKELAVLKRIETQEGASAINYDVLKDAM